MYLKANDALTTSNCTESKINRNTQHFESERFNSGPTGRI